MMGIDFWYENHTDMITFARALDAELYFENVDVIDFFEEPYKWTRQYRSWESYGKPDPTGSELERAVWDEMVMGEWSICEEPPTAAPGEQKQADLENDDIAAGVRPS